VSSWPRVPLGDLVVEERPQRSDSDEPVWNLNLDQIEPDTGRVLEHVRVPQDDLGPSTYPFAAGTVLYSKLRPYLNKVVVADEPGFATTELVPLRCKPQTAVPSYIAYFLRSAEFLSFANTVVAGAKMPRMVMSEFWKYQAPLPPIDEQRRIAAILDKADALRTKRREALAQLDRLAQSIFVEMFGDPVSGMFRWPVKPLSECCQAINDCPHSTPTWKDTGYVCLRTSNLTEGDWNWDDRRFVAEDEYHERSKRGYIEPGDIVLSREGTVGVAAIVRPGMEVCMGQRLVQVRCAPSSILPEYLLHHLLHVLQPSRISRLMVGSTAQHLNVKELRALPTPLPPVALQQQFAMRIQRIKTLYPQHEESIAESNALFSSLGQLFFRGDH
jgi:type I restriction enzyme S subunit